MTNDAELQHTAGRSICRTGYHAKALGTLLVGYVLSPYAVWGLFAHIGFVNSTIDPLSKGFYAPLQFLADRVDFIDDFYRWQCDLFWP